MSAKRFLLVAEDDAAVREILVEQLEAEQGFTVAVAGTLSEADRAIKAHDGRFDAVILDVGMPDGDGCDIAPVFGGRATRCPSSC